jgi:hypothetical protein
MLNTSYANNTSDSSNNFHKHAFIEAGGGYILKLTDKTIFDVYAGVGSGSIAGRLEYSLFTNQEDFVSRRYYRVFIQPSIGSKTDYYELGFALRIGYFESNNLINNSSLKPTASAFFNGTCFYD